MYIGFFDSGIGGITVLREAVKLLPQENFIYYADTQHVPYGIKPKDEVKKYIFEAVDFLVGKRIKMLVVACNTATSIAIKDLRQQYGFPIIGMEPAVKPAVEKNGKEHKRVLVVATPLTLKEEKFQNLVSEVDYEHIVDYLPLPGLVEYAEKFEFNEQGVAPYLKEKLLPYNMDKYGTIVLGCTHFPFYRDVFKKILPGHIDIIDGNVGTVRHMKRVLEENGLMNKSSKTGNMLFYASGIEVDHDTRLKFEMLLGR